VIRELLVGCVRPPERSFVKVDFSKYTAVQIERDGPVLRVWFDRPDQLNAVSREVHGELACLLAQPDPALRWTKLSINGGLRAIASSVLDAAAGLENLTQILPVHRAALERMRDRK